MNAKLLFLLIVALIGALIEAASLSDQYVTTEVPNPAVSLLPGVWNATQTPASPTKKYQFRKKISFSDKFDIDDEKGLTVFTIKRIFFSFRDKFIVEDSNGTSLYKIQKEFFHLMPHYNIISTLTDEKVATLKKTFTFLKSKFEITSIYGDYKIQTEDILASEFSITKNGSIVATVSKNLFAFTDKYGIEIAKDENHAFIISLMVAVDNILADIHDIKGKISQYISNISSASVSRN